MNQYNGYKIVNGRKQKDGFVCGGGTSVIPYRACVAVKIADKKVMVGCLRWRSAWLQLKY